MRRSDQEAIEIARQRAAQRDSFGLELARYTGELMKSPRVPAGVAERSFILVEVAGNPIQYLSLVRAGLAHDDPAIRISAIALLRAQAKTPGWLPKLAADPDERVRGGAMEPLWRQHGPEIEQILKAASHERVK